MRNARADETNIGKRKRGYTMKDTTFLAIITPFALIYAAVLVLGIIPACSYHITITL